MVLTRGGLISVWVQTLKVYKLKLREGSVDRVRMCVSPHLGEVFLIGQ